MGATVVQRPCKHCLYELGLLSFVSGSSLINQQISAAFLDTCVYLGAEDCRAPRTLSRAVEKALGAAGVLPAALPAPSSQPSPTPSGLLLGWSSGC